VLSNRPTIEPAILDDAAGDSSKDDTVLWAGGARCQNGWGLLEAQESEAGRLYVKANGAAHLRAAVNRRTCVEASPLGRVPAHLQLPGPILPSLLATSGCSSTNL